MRTRDRRRTDAPTWLEETETDSGASSPGGAGASAGGAGPSRGDATRSSRRRSRPEGSLGRLWPGGMLPQRSQRLVLESAFMRLIATAGVIGIGVALGAILAGGGVQGWIIGLVTSMVSVLLAAMLWSSREL